MLILPTDAPRGGLILSIVIQPKIWLTITFEVCVSKVVDLAEGLHHYGFESSGTMVLLGK